MPAIGLTPVWKFSDCYSNSNLHSMLELHIWGPAFGLPSIDAECLATIHYFRYALSNNSWCLVPSNNPSLNPYQRLPALRTNTIWIAGFDEIVRYLRECVSNTKDLDADLNDIQQADCDAYSSFLYSRGIPLLDLSLYVSSDNYTTCTRGVLGDLLSWPQSWTIPHELRDRAKRRSEHLRLSALDVDTVQDEEDQDTSLAAKIPKSLRKPKQTVSQILGRNVPKTRFRLKAVTEDFLEPLQTKLGERDWLINNSVSSADCLAIAIVTLMQIPQLPQGWLRETLAKKYSTLNGWASSHALEAYGNAATNNLSVDGTVEANPLPWRTPLQVSWTETSVLAIETIVGSIPLFRWGYDHRELPENVHGSKSVIKSQHRKQQVYTNLRRQQRWYSQLVFGFISTTSILGYMAHIGLVTFPRFWSTKPSRRNFGEAGALLGL